MRRFTILACAVALTGCGWDMTKDVWDRAAEMCAAHGGLFAADEHSTSGGGVYITARCASGVIVKGYFDRRGQ